MYLSLLVLDGNICLCLKHFACLGQVLVYFFYLIERQLAKATENFNPNRNYLYLIRNISTAFLGYSSCRAQNN